MNEPLHLPDERELGEWLRGSGPDVDVAVCTRARFARNLDGHRFSTSQTAEDAKELLTMLREQLPPALDPIVQHLRVLDVSDFGPIERDLLVERHLISRELAHHPRPAAAVVDPLERVSVMLNEEDHLRLQVFRSGFDVQGAYSAAERLDDAILDALPIAFSEEFCKPLFGDRFFGKMLGQNLCFSRADFYLLVDEFCQSVDKVFFRSHFSCQTQQNHLLKVRKRSLLEVYRWNLHLSN